MSSRKVVVGESVSLQPTPTTDRLCEGWYGRSPLVKIAQPNFAAYSPLGSFNNNEGHSDTRCQPWRECGPGSYVKEQGNSSHDRLCHKCESHKYQDESNQDSCKECDGGFYSTSPNAQAICPAGFACVACERELCKSGETFQALPGATECKQVTRCGVGQKVVRMPTTISDTVCDACEEGSFNEDTSHSALTCSNATTSCRPGWYVFQRASVTADRECQNCDPGFYSAAINAASCLIQTRCDPGEYQIVAPTATSDRTCGSKWAPSKCLCTRLPDVVA